MALNLKTFLLNTMELVARLKKERCFSLYLKLTKMFIKQAELELEVYYLMVSSLILTQLPYADTAYSTQFSSRAELQLRNKLPRVVGWVVGGAAGEMKNKAKLILNWV